MIADPLELEVVSGGTVTVETPTDEVTVAADTPETIVLSTRTEGQGLPGGGTAGQALLKTTDDDFDADWGDIVGGTGAVDSVNGQTGVVVLVPADIDAASQADLVALADDLTTEATTARAAEAAAIATAAADATTKANAAQAASQPLDSDLTAIAALSTTSYGRAFLALADAAAARTALSLGTAALSASTDFQPVDSDLTSIAALTTTSYGRALLTLADLAALRTTLGTGTQSSSTYLRGDGTWSTVAAANTQAVRIVAAAKTTGTIPIATPLVPMVAGPSTLAIALGRHVLCPAVHSGQTVTTLYVIMTATSLTGSQQVIVTCYANQSDDTPGVIVWQQGITIGAGSPGNFTATSLSLAMPNGPCWIGVLNPSGNAGTVTLRTGSPTMAGSHVGMQNGTWSPMKDVTAAASASSDMSAYLLRSTSTGATVIGVEQGATFPIVGALA